MADLNEFAEWVNEENTDRKITIELKTDRAPEIRAYDLKLTFYGQNVNNVSEIDIPGIVQAKRYKQYQDLKKEFDPVTEVETGGNQTETP